MRDLPLHPRKPLPIEHISDDIRELRKAQTHQQKVVFSGRAIADLLAGDTFDYGNASDKGYYTDVAGAGGAIIRKLDFNKVTDASIRYVGDSKCLNFPDGLTDNTGLCRYTGFLFTAAVLPNGSITWDEKWCIEHHAIPAGGTTYETSRPVSVRQIYYTDNLIDYDTYTRIGRYVPTYEEDGVTISSWGWVWTDWKRGTVQRILVTEATRSLLDTIRTNVIYELHLSASITLPPPDNYPTGTSITFEQYSNNQATYEAALTDSYGIVRPATAQDVPSPLIRYYVYTTNSSGTGKHYVPAGYDQGWLTTFEVGTEYYTQSSPAAWMSDVKFTEKVKKITYTKQTGTNKLIASEDIVEETYKTQLIPALDTLRTSDVALEAGDWTRNVATAMQYRYEIVDREEPVEGSDRTWMLDVDAEALTRTSDMVELLDAHTDPMVTDIVQYSARQFRGSLNGDGTEGNDTNVNTGNTDFMNSVPHNNKPLIVSQTVGMCGWAKFEIVVNNKISKLPNDFGISIYKFNEYSSGFQRSVAFSYTVTADTKPNIYKKYYVVDGNGKFTNKGYITAFDAGTVYYERSVNYGNKSAMSEADFITVENGGVSNKMYKAKFFQNADTSEDPFKKSWFTAGNPLTGFIRCYRNDTILVVVSSSKHFSADVENNPGSASIVSPTVEFYPDPHDTYLTKLHLVPNAITKEELNKFPKPGENNEEVAGALSVVEAYELLARHLQAKGLLFGNIPTNTGDFNSVTSPGVYTVNTSGWTNGPGFTCSTTSNASLVVIASTAYPSNAILPPTSESDSLNSGHKAASTTDQSMSGSIRITQILVSNGDNGSTTRMWVRTGNGSTWTPWTTTQYAVRVFNIGNSLDATTISNALMYCTPTFVMSGNSSVTLPAASSFPGAKMQVEVVGGSVTITQGSFTYTNSTVKSSPHRMLYPLESDGSVWSLVTVN